MIAALAQLPDLPWRLVIAGDRGRSPATARQLDAEIGKVLAPVSGLNPGSGLHPGTRIDADVVRIDQRDEHAEWFVELARPALQKFHHAFATNAGGLMDRLGGGMAPMPLVAQVPVGQLMVQAQRQAAYSRARLEEDVAALKRYNQDVDQVNERAIAALEAAVRPKPGPKRQAWVTWWKDLVGSATSATPPVQDLDRERESSQAAVEKRAMLPSFGAARRGLARDGLGPYLAKLSKAATQMRPDMLAQALKAALEHDHEGFALHWQRLVSAT